MKTYEEFRLMIMELDFPLPVPHAKIEELAAKEYAKQWIDRASQIATIDEEMRTFDGAIVKADSHKEYKFNSQKFKYTLTVDKDSIQDLKKEIDAHGSNL